MAKKKIAKKKKQKSVEKRPAKGKPANRSAPAAELPPAVESPKITPHPTAGRKVLEFESRLDAVIAGEPEKRGRGRPRKPPEPAGPEPQEIGLDIVKPVVKMPFDLWSARQGLDKLKITDQEAAQIAEPLKVLLDYYLPQIPTIAYAWISLAVVSYTVFQPRLELIQQIKKATAPDAAGDQGGQKPAADADRLRSVIVEKNSPQNFPSEIKTEKL